jgi:hypothetical protein
MMMAGAAYVIASKLVSAAARSPQVDARYTIARASAVLTHPHPHSYSHHFTTTLAAATPPPLTTTIPTIRSARPAQRPQVVRRHHVQTRRISDCRVFCTVTLARFVTLSCPDGNLQRSTPPPHLPRLHPPLPTAALSRSGKKKSHPRAPPCCPAPPPVPLLAPLQPSR